MSYLIAPLPAMLGIRAGSKVSVINPPAGFVHRLNPLPEGVEFLVTASTGLDVILYFTFDTQELVSRLPALSRAMAVNGGIWVCWPTNPELKSPLSEELIRQTAFEVGLVDNKLCALDTVWTGLRLVWRPNPRPEKPSLRKTLPAAEA